MEQFAEGESTREEIKNKLRQNFDGKIVRKDLTKKIKEGANVPVYVLEFLLGQYCSSDDEAVIIMVDSNIQRENILPSEKAFAYKMKLEAMKQQGAKGTGDTADLVGKEAGDSGRKVQRYIRLTELLPELLDMVDNGKIKFIPAVSLSYLSKEEQAWVQACIKEKSVSVSGVMADALKKHSEDGKLTELAVQLILSEEKKDTGKVTLPGNKISRYFPKEYSRQQIEQVIFELLDNWKNSH